MEIRNFWSTWNKGYKAIYISLLCMLIGVILISGYFQIFGLDSYIPLEVARKTESIDLSLQKVQGLSTEYIDAFKSYVVFQTTLALKVISVNNLTYVFFAIFTLGLAFLATAATYLSRLWFLISQSIFVIWIITLKIPYLQVLGVSNNYLEYAFIIAFLGLGYLLHAIYTEVSLLKKFFAFIFLCSVILLAINFGGNQADSILYVAHHAIIIPIMISFIFIANVSYDVVLAILSLLSSKKSGDNSSNLRHFLTLSLLYLAYVSLTFLRNNLSIDWAIIYLDEFFLLTISTVIGIWGFKKRSELIKKQLDFTPLGSYVYLVMAIITFSTLAWLFATANDALIETFEDVIIFSHIGFCIAFIVFVIFNYLEFLRKGLAIIKVVWQPKRLPTAIIRLVGIVIVILLIFRANYTPYFQALSGYYNSAGIYYSEIGESEPAKTNFQVAKQYASTNHLSNFQLGIDYYNKKDWVKSSYYFGKATFKRPSVQAFLNRAQAQLNGGIVFEALFTLEDANNTFPDNPYLLNMKGIVFEKLNQIDSSYLYFESAMQLANSDQIIELSLANKLALLAKNKIMEPIDLTDIDEASVLPLKANLLANANLQGIYLGDIIRYKLPSDSVLTYNDFSLIFNLLSNQSIGREKMELDLEPLISMKTNEPFSKSLLYAMAINNNYVSRQKKSYSQIYELENAEISDAGYYHLIHGFWLMDQSAYAMAIEQFVEAEKLKVENATYCKIMALIQDGRLYEAALSYDQMISIDSINKFSPLNHFLNATVDSLSLEYKYLWYAKNDALSLNERQELERAFRGTYYEDLINLETIHKGLNSIDFVQAKNKLKAIKVNKLNEDILPYYHNLMALAFSLTKDSNLLPMLNEDLLTIYPKNYQLLYESFSAKEGNQKTCDSLMFSLGMQNVFFEEGIMQATNYFNGIGKYQEAYTILVEAARLNPKSVQILKSYILQSLRVNMRSYARTSLEELTTILSQNDYDIFLKEYDLLMKEIDDRPW